MKCTHEDAGFECEGCSVPAWVLLREAQSRVAELEAVLRDLLVVARRSTQGLTGKRVIDTARAVLEGKR